MIYLMTSGSYSDYSVGALLSGPDDLDFAALAREFAPLYDHGEALVQARCVHMSGIGQDEPWPCAHERERETIRAWRRERGWPEDNVLEAFTLWLGQKGCYELRYEEVNTEDIPLLPDQLVASIAVRYDPAYNGDGSNYPPVQGQGTLHTLYMPVSSLRTYGGVPVRAQIGQWLEQVHHLSAGNLVSYNLDQLYDAEGNPF